jgi:hypothetical protein
MAGLLGNMDNLRGILAQPSTNDFALALLANSGYSNRRRGLGEIIGTSMLQSRQMAAEQAQQKLREQFMRAQIEAMQQKPQAQEELAIVIGEDGKPVYVPRSQAIGKSPYEKPSGATSLPTTVQEYEIAKSQGYGGTFMDYRRDVARMGQSPGAAAQRPAAIETYEYLRNLPPDEQAAMLGSMRAQQVVPIAGVPNVITPTGTRPLSTPEAETAAKRDAARATAEGTAQVEGQGKKNAVASMNYVIGEMRKQIDSTLQGGPMGLTGMVGRVTDSQTARRFDNLREQLSTELRTVFRIPGEGTLSDREQAQYGLQLPDVRNSAANNNAILNDLQARVGMRVPGAAPAAPAAPEAPAAGSGRRVKVDANGNVIK